MTTAVTEHTYIDRNGDEYTVEVNEDTYKEWADYTGNILAAIQAGLLDAEIYNIAKMCHERHLLLKGQTPADPDDDTDSDDADVTDSSGNPSQTPIDPNAVAHRTLSASRQVFEDNNAGRYFTYNGKKYNKADLIGYFYVGTPKLRTRSGHTLAGYLLRIEGVGKTRMTVRVMATNGNPGKNLPLGSVIEMPVSIASEIFA